MSNGIQSHSSPAAFEQYVIFSTLPEKVKSLQDYLRATHDPQGLGHKYLIGCYKGEIEPAWIVNSKRLPELYKHGFLDGQESILILDHCRNGGARPARLEFLKSGESVDLGLFRQSSEEFARKCDAWSYDPQQNLYFVCD